MQQAFADLKTPGKRRHADLRGGVREHLACCIVGSHRPSIAHPAPIETSLRSKA